MNSISLVEIADRLGGNLENAGDHPDRTRITGVNTLKDASASEISFLSNKRYRQALPQTGAAAVLLSPREQVPEGCTVIRVADPYLAFAQMQRFFYTQPESRGARHASAVIDPSAQLSSDVDVGANAVIAAHVQIGKGSVIGAGCVVGEGVCIGERALLHANAVVERGCILGNDVILQPGCIIGSDGFGYAWSGTNHLKIPQVGRAILEDDVEIGANSCIDRGAIGDTVIERGVKLDNQIQIAHNVRVGAYSVMASQVGISGSTTVGKGCQFGGQAGLAGHISIGDGVKLAAKSGVMSDLEAGGVYAGAPVMPHRLWLKVSALTARLPELWKMVRKS